MIQCVKIFPHIVGFMLTTLTANTTISFGTDAKNVADYVVIGYIYCYVFDQLNISCATKVSQQFFIFTESTESTTTVIEAELTTDGEMETDINFHIDSLPSVQHRITNSLNNTFCNRYMYSISGCEDISLYCAKFAHEYNCKYNNFVRFKCKESCGLCGKVMFY